jgi:tRNA threonylcarbamoyladenosine biosynthesis protein TsaB
VQQLQVVAVSSGPGSFTGLRVGISTAQGLALSQEKVLIGVSTLEVVAYQAYGLGRQVCPMIDSRRGEVYTALYRYDGNGALQQVMDAVVMKPEQWLPACTEPTIFLGSGAALYRAQIKTVLHDLATVLPPECGIPRAASVAHLALKRFRENGQNDLESFSPVYIRPPDAELKSPEPTGSFVPASSS